MKIMDYPFDGDEILRKKRALRRGLLERGELLEKRVAILGGSTIGDIRDVLEIFLLYFGVRPQFYIGQYNRFYEEVMFENRELADFRPDIVYLHTSARNLSDDALPGKLRAVWAKLRETFPCSIIQNNFELPALGPAEERRRINALNIEIADYAKENKGFYVNDLQYLSASFGLGEWFDEQAYYLYKYAFSVRAIPLLCHNLAKIVKALYGKNQKCLVLDLDNTLWGGVVGETGAAGIELGMETALGEGYLAFQKYVKALRDRGVILAVCSKNDEPIAKEAFGNPNMALKLEDIAVFLANWESKAENILKIAESLNILPESIVFIDDNPAERELVRQALPEVKVPEVGSVADFIRQIEMGGYFYPVALSGDDMRRSDYYRADAERNATKSAFVDYGEYLRSLRMKSEMRPFAPEHFERITQLINKTNQFNLTTARYSLSEIEAFASAPGCITLYATLDDKFGGNGIVSILIGERAEQSLHIRLWVMSCRVFKRGLELAVLDRLVAEARRAGIETLIGHYYPTAKNGIVRELYGLLGFRKTSEDETGRSVWEYAVDGHIDKNREIELI